MVASIHLLYQTAHHLLAGIEVGNHSVSQRTDGTYVFVGFFMHQLRLFPHGNHLFCTAIQSYNRRLIHHDFSVRDDDSIGCAQVHCYLLCKRK
jgi:hypothetical protein